MIDSIAGLSGTIARIMAGEAAPARPSDWIHQAMLFVGIRVFVTAGYAALVTSCYLFLRNTMAPELVLCILGLAHLLVALVLVLVWRRA